MLKRKPFPSRTLFFILPLILASLNTWAGGFDENTLKELKKLSLNNTLPAKLQRLVEVAITSDARGKEIEGQGEEKKAMIEENGVIGEKGVINERSLSFYKYANKAKELIDKVQGLTPKHKDYEKYLEKAQAISEDYRPFEYELLNRNQNQDMPCPPELLAKVLNTPGLPEKAIATLDPASQRCAAQVNHLFNRAAKAASRLVESLRISSSDKRPLQEILKQQPTGSRMKNLSFDPGKTWILSEDVLKLIVEKFPHLSSLDLANTKVTGAGLVHLKGLKQLSSLNLSWTGVTDAELVHLKDLAQLSELSLAHTQVTGAGFVHFENLKQLSSLDLTFAKVTDDRLALLKDLTQLSKINLYLNIQVTDAGLVHFKNLKHLSTLGLYNTQVTNAGLVHLKDHNELFSLNLYNTKVTGAGLVHLKDHPQLSELILGRANGESISNDDLIQLKDFKHLTSLGLVNTQLTDDGLVHLKVHEQKLTSLDLSGTRITNAGLVHLKDFKQLRSLSFRETDVTGAGLVHLKDLNLLSHLDLTRVKVTDADLALLKGLEHLTSLDLSLTEVTDACLAHLMGLKHLTYLDLSHTNVTQDGVAKLKKSNPKLTIKASKGLY